MGPSSGASGDALSDAEIREILDHLGALESCPACGHHRWVIMDDPREYLAALLVPHDKEMPRDHLRHMPLTVMLCENCALVRPHATTILRAKLEEKRASEGQHDND